MAFYAKKEESILKNFFIGLLIVSLSINVLKIIVIYIFNLIENHKLKIGERCKYLSDDDLSCENIIGRITYNKNSKCMRNKCTSCTQKNKVNIEHILDDNKIINCLIKTSEIIAQISASVLIIWEVLGE